MDAIDCIRTAAANSATVLTMYLEDLTDEDLMSRPGEGCNHLAWQLGHLIASEVGLLTAVCPDAQCELPDGFADKHSKESAGEDDPKKFCTKNQYLELFARVQAATDKALDGLTEKDLDAPAPEGYRPMFPTVGHVMILIATHPLMHSGQFVPVRRKLGKPVVI